VILSNTFGASRIMLERHGLAAQTAEINRRGAEISARAARGRAKVFASIGPSGAMLMMGEVTEDDLHAAFLEQAQALREGGADGLVIETMGDLQEAALAVRAARATGLPVVASMVFDAGPDKDRTMMGTTPEQAAEGLREAGADAIGANCGQGITGFHAICRRMRAAVDLPLWMKANAGLPHLVDGQAVYDARPDDFAREAEQLVAEGAAFVGGCCGTSPDFVKALAARLGRPGAGA
jgi:5-methyltetrahydrofolate--homocysteine methyltransferase